MDHEACDDGYDAYWDGADVSENPFDADEEPDAFKSWEDGWRKAREHDYDESD